MASSSDRVFTVSGDNITIAGSPTLVFINPDVDVGIEILRCWIGQEATETSEQQRVNLVTQISVFPTLTSKSPAPHLLGATSRIVGGTAGAAGTSGIDATAEGAGAKTIILSDSFNNLNGWVWLPTPEERIILRASASSGFGLRLAKTPATLTGWDFGVTFAEL